MASTVRSFKDSEEMIWFPIKDIVGFSLRNVDTGELKPSVSSWLRRNIPTGSVRKLNIPSEGKKGRKTLCISADQVIILSTYETHISNGGDFRARWSLLPDKPALTTKAKLELAWRNVYRWSLSEHSNKLKINTTKICELRNLHIRYKNIFGKDPEGSLEETYLEIANNT